MIRLLKGNQIEMFRNSEQILEKCKPVLSKELLQRLKEVLYNINPAKFQGSTTA